MPLIEASGAKSTESDIVVTSVNVNQSSENNSVKTFAITKEVSANTSRFKSPGVIFNAKLIGVEEVHGARGDKMCQDSMAKLKMAVKQAGLHKQRIIVNVSLQGVRILDHRTQTISHTHPVHKISFISRDVTDKRAFGYIYGVGDGRHKFFAIKTEKAAEAVVLALRDLFQVVYEMKKLEVEEAKQKIEEPSNKAVQEDKKTEIPSENGSAASDQAAPNSQPVADEASDLLCLETELETIEKRLEQIDTMEELFKELEAPPVTKSSSSWANELGSLSDGVQSQSQSMFSLGGAPFSASQAFPSLSSPQMPFGAQPFGMPNPVAAGSYGMQKPSAAQPNPFQLPPVPARTGMGFPGQPNPYPGTPFPTSQPYFPRNPHMAVNVPMFQPAVTLTPANDPFGENPFASSNSAFEESILKPARIDSASPTPEFEVQKSKDFFGDLVDIGAKTKASKSPKELFTDLSTPEKKPLNQMKVEKVVSPKPGSPFGSQASEVFGEPSGFDNFPAPDSFITSNPHAFDPLASSNSTSHDDLFELDIFGDETYLSKPLPLIPPPPLPNGIIINSPPPADYKCIPLPPPRSSCIAHIPPLPPRPKLSSDLNLSSRSTMSSLSDSLLVDQQQMPPFPHCTKTDCNTVPRSCPKPTCFTKCHNNEINLNHTEQNMCNGSVMCNKCFTTEFDGENSYSSNPHSLSSTFSHTSAKSKSKESQQSDISKVLSSCAEETCIVVNPFLYTDPFASEDQFSQMNPFLDDPFAADPFSGSCPVQPFANSDPFTSVVDSREAGISCGCDPFAVFDENFDK